MHTVLCKGIFLYCRYSRLQDVCSLSLCWLSGCSSVCIGRGGEGGTASRTGGGGERWRGMFLLRGRDPTLLHTNYTGNGTPSLPLPQPAGNGPGTWLLPVMHTVHELWQYLVGLVVLNRVKRSLNSFPSRRISNEVSLKKKAGDSDHVSQTGNHDLHTGNHILQTGNHALQTRNHVLQTENHVLLIGNKVLQKGNDITGTSSHALQTDNHLLQTGNCVLQTTNLSPQHRKQRAQLDSCRSDGLGLYDRSRTADCQPGGEDDFSLLVKTESEYFTQVRNQRMNTLLRPGKRELVPYSGEDREGIRYSGVRNQRVNTLLV
jgi:hypothetical protein